MRLDDDDDNGSIERRVLTFFVPFLCVCVVLWIPYHVLYDVRSEELEGRVGNGLYNIFCIYLY